jgi:hypothetical protein
MIRAKKKKQLILMKVVINHVSNSGQWWNMPKVCPASSHTTSTAQSAEQPSRHKQSHTVAAVFTHKKTITVTSIRLKILVIL